MEGGARLLGRRVGLGEGVLRLGGESAHVVAEDLGERWGDMGRYHNEVAEDLAQYTKYNIYYTL